MTSIEWLLEQLENYDNELPYYKQLLITRNSPDI